MTERFLAVHAFVDRAEEVRCNVGGADGVIREVSQLGDELLDTDVESQLDHLVGDELIRIVGDGDEEGGREVLVKPFEDAGADVEQVAGALDGLDELVLEGSRVRRGEDDPSARLELLGQRGQDVGEVDEELVVPVSEESLHAGPILALDLKQLVPGLLVRLWFEEVLGEVVRGAPQGVEGIFSKFRCLVAAGVVVAPLGPATFVWRVFLVILPYRASW